jgi:hypothetical protein
MVEGRKRCFSTARNAVYGYDIGLDAVNERCGTGAAPQGLWRFPPPEHTGAGPLCCGSSKSGDVLPYDAGYRDAVAITRSECAKRATQPFSRWHLRVQGQHPAVPYFVLNIYSMYRTSCRSRQNGTSGWHARTGTSRTWRKSGGGTWGCRTSEPGLGAGVWGRGFWGSLISGGIEAGQHKV